jgi:glycosidase
MVLSCARDEEPVPTGCGIVAWHRPLRADARVELRASWEGFSIAHPMKPAADGWRALPIEPPPGEQLYAIVEDGVWKTDAAVGTTAFATVDGALREVTWIEAGCTPRVTIESASASETGAVTVVARVPGPAAAAIRDRALPVTMDGSVARVSTTLPPGKHRITVTSGAASATATVWVGKPWDWRDAVIYEVMVDRFRDAGGGPLPAPSPISARAGGHLDGVRKSLDSLVAMGVNTLWLTPLYANAAGEFPGLDGRPYTSYHGYWPTAPRTIASSLGGEAALDALIEDAHRRSMRVIFDVVPNHVHQDHPYAAAHPEWFHGVQRSDGSWVDPCVCGTAACPWGENSLSCWFAPYMPDVDWRNGDAARTFADDVAWWIERFDGDGVRIDAVPLMPRAAIRRIAYRVRSRFDHPGNRTLVLGEIFTGSEGYDALRFFMGPSGLDSAFEFPLMWSLRGALADRSAPMSAIDTTFRAGEQAFSGSGAVVSLIVGNHDVPRFASVAAGDGGRDGWDPAPQPSDPAVYERLGVALGIVFALPGMPTIYYGDEVGLAGGGDPDSRRVMPQTVGAAETALRDRVGAMGRARACLDDLRRAPYRAVASDNERLIFSRGEVLVVATRSDTTRLETALPGFGGEWVDVLSGATRTFDETRSAFEEPANTVRYYVRKGHRCVP